VTLNDLERRNGRVVCVISPNNSVAFRSIAGDTLHHAVTLIFDPLTLNICCTSSVTWSKYVRNCSEIEQSSDELLII